MKKLLIMRHAKSDWGTGRPDHERPLNSRGTRAAEVMGRALATMGEVPDLVISSPAARAATTAQLAAAAGSWASAIRHSDALYGTSAHGALEVLLEADTGAAAVMLVGHEPTWSALVAHLTGGSVAMKTATVAAVELYIQDWSQALEARGELLYVLQPRSIAALVA